MKAVVLAGGLGTRLRPLTSLLPKPMVPVMNRPLLEHTLNLLKKHGVEEVIFLLFYLPDVIRNHFGNGANFGLKISYIVGNEDFGTAGAARLAAGQLQEPFFILSGDALTDIDLTGLMAFHKKHKGVATIALSSVQNPSPFGVAITDKNHRITRFLEKPAWSQIFSDTVNMGIYLLEPDIFDHIPAQKEVYFARNTFPLLLSNKRPLHGFISDCYWKDIGDLRTYLQVHRDVLAGEIALDLNGYKPGSTVYLHKNCTIHPSAHLENVVAGPGCKIGRYSTIKNVVLWDDVEIGVGCEITQSTIASGCKIGDHTRMGEHVFISQRVEIGARCQINSDIKIWPEKQIEVGSIVNASMVWGDNWRRELFSDSHVSGLANYEITPEFSAKLGAAFGAWLRPGASVLLSRDASHASRMVYRSVITGLMSAGVNVNTVQVMPIPIVRHALPSIVEKGGIHIRRSPLDRKVVDILFFDEKGRDLSNQTSKAVERMFFREDFPRVGIDKVGRIEYPVRVADSYISDFLNHVDLKVLAEAKFKIVLDYSHGAATQVFPAILGHFDWDVVSLNAHPDSNRLSRTPLESERALLELSSIVKSTHANAGFLIDAGAEHIQAIDDTGRILSGERLAVIICHLFLQTHHPTRIAGPVSIPSQIPEMADKHGVVFNYTSEDLGALVNATENPDISLSIGRKGGFVFTDFHFAFDGMFSLVKLLELLACSQTTLAELNDELPQKSFANRTVACPWEAKGRVMRQVTEFSEGKSCLLLDGVKILLDDAWVLVIADRDRAACHIIAESSSAKQTSKLIDDYESLVKNWIQN